MPEANKYKNNCLHSSSHDYSSFAREVQSLKKCEEVNFRKNENIIVGGDQPTHIYIIKTGYVRSFRINQNGQFSILGLHYPGEIIGSELIIDDSSDYFASSIGKSTLFKVPVETFLQSKHSTKLLSLKLKSLQNLLGIFCKLSATEKICWFILRHSINQNSKGYITNSFELGFSRNDIANFIGITSETLSRIMNRLKLEHIIALDGKYISILDFTKLLEKVPSEWKQYLSNIERGHQYCPICDLESELADTSSLTLLG